MHTCNFCEDLVSRISRPQIESPHRESGLVNIEAINVGWLNSIISNRSQCTLCSLIARIWDKVGLLDANIESNEASVAELLKGVYVCFDNATPTYLTRDGTRLQWLIHIDFFKPGHNGRPSIPVSTRWEPRFALSVNGVDRVGLAHDELPFLLGRRRRHQVPYDTDFLKACFDTCLTKHGMACDRPVRTFDGKNFPLDNDEELPLRMRCIDVVSHNIVYVPRDGSCQYAILSYVWGKSNYLLLTKANYAQLTTRDGLRNVRVPQTISDAMEVTAALGLRYLWVDALCIIQDYPSEQYQVIQKMHKIYASAVLTIVAAGANNADDGLWTTTIGTRQPQIVEEVTGIEFIATEPTLERVLRDSVWTNRAWTYQEYVLSKRLLVFSATQAYYSCESGSCAEDHIYTIRRNGQQDVFHPSADDEPSIPVDRLLNFPIFWRTLIKEYSQRQLSFESDGLNAATGVMASYSVGSKDSFACGLPINDLFEYSILWYSSSEVLRRRGPLPNGESFPTWSWVGWVGSVTYEDLGVVNDLESSRIIHCWRLMSVHKTLCCAHGELTIEFNTIPKSSIDNVSTKQLLEHKADIDRHLSTMSSCTLNFTTRVAKLRIDPTYDSQLLSSDDTLCESTGLYKLFHGDKWIGSIHMEHHTARQFLQDHHRYHDFMALSINATGQWDVLARDNKYSDPDERGMFDQDLLGDSDDGHDVYNVMLAVYKVDSDGNSDSLVATRAGVGQIHKNSFDMAGPFLKEFQLG